MTINLSVQPSYGPPAFFEPQLPVPPATLREIQMATSLAGQNFFKNWLNRPESIGETEDWVNFLFLLSIATHFDSNWVWDELFPLMPQAFQTFRIAGYAMNTPIALYWPNIIAPLLYHHPAEKNILDLAREVFVASDSVTRGSIVKMLCLSRDETTAKGAMDILLPALNDHNEVVRAETILSLIRCGPIPAAAHKALESCLNHPATFLPAASALYHLTGNAEYFAMLQEAGEGRKLEVALQAANALEPWPTRQCIIESCHAPIQFKDYWMQWRKHVTPTNFKDAYQLWNSPAVKFFCCRCYNNITDMHSDTECDDSE